MNALQPTDVQREKYNKFLSHELKDPSVAFLNEIIQASGLLTSEIGKTWGVTLFPDAKTILRINIGNWEFARVNWDNDRKQAIVMFFVIGEPRMGLLTPVSVYVVPGFETIDNDFGVCMNLGSDMTRMLGKKSIKSGLQKSVATRSKKGMPNSKWHNPLSEQLIIKN